MCTVEQTKKSKPKLTDNIR